MLTYSSSGAAGLDAGVIQVTDVTASTGHMPIVKLAVSEAGSTVLVPSSSTAGLKVTLGTEGVSGGVAHDAADSGAPVKIGAYAGSSEPASVANGDRVNVFADLSGRPVILPFAPTESYFSGTAGSSSTGATTLAVPASTAHRLYVTSAQITNTSTSATYVELRNGSSAIATIPAPAGGGAVLTFPTPLRLALDSTCGFAAGAAVSAITVSVQGWQGR